MPNELEYPPERTTIALVNGILIDLQHLVEQQMQLTRREIEKEIRQRSSAVVVFAVGIGVLFLDAIVLCFTLVHLMHWGASPPETDVAWLPLWACYGVVALVLGMVGAILIYVGRAKYRYVDRCRSLAVQVIQESVPWTTTRT
jgi:hypothetical protein